MILELASKATAQPIETSVPATVKAPAANSAGVLSKPISFSNGVKTEEEVQALDALAEIREMTFGPLKKRADIERSFSFSYKGMFETDPVTSSSELAHTFSVSLGEAHGYGPIVFYTNLEIGRASCRDRVCQYV